MRVRMKELGLFATAVGFLFFVADDCVRGKSNSEVRRERRAVYDKCRPSR